MAGRKVAVTTFVRDPKGQTVTLRRGDVVPDYAIEQVTNEAVFKGIEQVETAQAPAGPGGTETRQSEKRTDEDDVNGGTEAKADGKGPDLEYDVKTEPESDKDYRDRSGESLAAAAEARGLAKSGSKDVIATRLEADDAERAKLRAAADQ